MKKDDFELRLRARQAGPQEAVVYSRNHTIRVGRPVSFGESDPLPTALELLLGALAGDLVNSYQALADRKGLTLEGLEAAVTGRLDNPLRALGVVGEEGHPGLSTLQGTLYVSADAEPSVLEEIFAQAQDRSPLVHTLRRCAELTLSLQVQP